MNLLINKLKSKRLQEANKFFFRNLLVEPHLRDKDEARREFILKVLLAGLIMLCAFGFLINLIHPLFYPNSEGQNPIITGGILLFVLCLFLLSRSKNSQLAAHIFIWFLFFVAIFMAYYWGPDLPAVLLFSALLIVMAGILISTRFAFLVASSLAAGIIVISYLELTRLYQPHIEWKQEVIKMLDAVVYVIIFGIIAVVSWLSNRELEKTLVRARRSEIAVIKQRDNLEIVVARRTKELKQVQAEKLTQLYKFAEFGRMSTGLFHDLATPLNLISLNLDRLSHQNKKNDLNQISDSKVLIKRALDGTRRLEDFILAARKQIQSQNTLEVFSLTDEINQAIQILEYKAGKSHVVITKKISDKIMLFGNSSKFSQVITNLISNAIDAYNPNTVSEKKVDIRLRKEGEIAILQIQDWGIGIDNKNIYQIFEPLFTTKSSKRGMGMGLSICKDIVEKDFKGKIDVVSVKNSGTIFSITIPIKRNKLSV